MGPQIVYRQLSLIVHATEEWPQQLLDGTDAQYNTELLRAGLNAQRTAEEHLHKAREKAHADLEEQLRHLQQERREAREAPAELDACLKAAHERTRKLEETLAQERQVRQDREDATRVREEGITTQLRQTAQKLTEAREEAAKQYERGLKEGAENAKLRCIGREGEVFTETLLRRFFPNAAYTDVTKKGKEGDFLLEHMGCRIIGEVKSDDFLKPGGVAKFRADLVQTKADGGVFVFLRDTTCEKTGVFRVELRPVPVVFIYGVGRKPELVYSAIQCLVDLIKLSKSESRSGDVEAVRTAVAAILDGPIQKSIRDLRGCISRMANTLATLETQVLDDIAKAVGVEAKLIAKPPKKAVLWKTADGQPDAKRTRV